MKNKELYKELIIVFIVVILLFLSIGISLFENQEDIIKKNKTVGASFTGSPYKTENAASYTPTGSERNDICTIAIAQKGIQEDGTPRNGYTPFHKWAANYYSSNWLTNSTYYEGWCLMFVNFCAYHAGVATGNYVYSENSPYTGAYNKYSSMGRLSTNQNDSNLEKGWVYLRSGHGALYVGDGRWVDGNSWDSVSQPAHEYVSYNNRTKRSFKGYGKPYYRAKITYHTNGGNSIGSVRYTEEKTDVTFPTPTKSGTSFLGWYTTSDFTGSKYTTSQSSWRGNKTLYAKWSDGSTTPGNDPDPDPEEPVVKKITYVMNNGWWNGAAGASSYTVGKGYTLPRNVQKGNGSAFIDWYTNSGCTNKITSISTSASTDIVVYAGYRAPISYVPNGGSWRSTPISSYIEKRETYLPTNITRPGCTFDGWFYDSGLTRRVTSGGKNDVIPTSAEGRITVYARWRATLTFDSMVGSWATSKNIRGVDGGPKKYMTYYPGINANNPGISSGKALYGASDLYEPWSYFAGWYTNSNLKSAYGPVYRIGETLSSGSWPWTRDLKLYARWIGYNYKIYLHGNKGDTTDNRFTKSADYEYYMDYQYRFRNNQYSLPAFATMYKRGYTFQHWHDNSSLSGKPVTRTDRDTGGNKDYYADWEPNKYPLILNSYRGKVTDTSYNFTDFGNYNYKYNKEYTYDTYVPLPTQPATVDRRGHTFDGWFREPDYSGTSVTQLIPGDIDTQEFYAKWTPITYQLVLHTNGANVTNPRIDNGRVVGDDIVGTYTYGMGSTFPVAPDDISKDDRIFSGWYKTADNSGSSYTGIASGDTDTSDIGDQEYWARWVKIEPNTGANDATEVVGDKLVLYLYFMGRHIVEGGSISKVITPISTHKRFFTLNISTDNASTTKREVTVWLSLSSSPDDRSQDLDSGWRFTTNSSLNKKNGSEHTIYDQCSITYTCPSDVVDRYIKEDGSRKVYLHLRTESGNTGTYEINLVKRVVYQLH